MLPSLEEIKIKRKQFGLTQSELAERAGDSQSLVAKIESGSLVPSYGNAKKLLDFLESLRKEKMVKARDIMSSRVHSIGPDETVRKAIKLMKKYAISQLPVMVGNHTIGTINERAVIEKAQGERELLDLSQLRVRDVMSDFMPIVGEDSDIGVISGLLEYNPGVLVAKKGKIRGIIAKSDLLSIIVKNHN